MDAVRQWVALAVAAVLAVLAAGWFLLVQPRRAEAAEVRALVAAQEGTNDQLRTQLQVLKAKAKDLPKEQARLAAVATKLPANPAQPALLRALAAAADSAGVELVSVAPQALAAVAPPAAATDATATTTTTTAAPATGTAGTLMSMQLTIKVAGGFYETEEFVAQLEDLPRALRVSGITLTPGKDPVQAAGAPTSTAPEDGRSLITDIIGTVYVASGASTAAGAADGSAVPTGAPVQ